jgi:hypothetical protein
MLRVERLASDSKWHHRNEWRRQAIRYQDDKLPILKERLQERTMRTGTAYRIIDDTGNAFVIKRGHDNRLFTYEVEI